MKKLRLLLILGLGVLVSCLNGATPETYTFGSFNGQFSLAIPDGNASGRSDTRTNTSSQIAFISQITVSLVITGGYNGDLYAYLRHSNGSVTNLAILLNRSGRTATDSHGYGDNGYQITLSDTATNDIHIYRAFSTPPTGSPLTNAWQPDARAVDPDVVVANSGRSAYLSSFNGMSANGDWTLFIADLESGGNATLVSWGLEIQGSSANQAPSFVKGGDQLVAQNSGATNVAGWATSLSAGPPSESGQTLNFLVTNNATYLFATPPAIDPTGTLTFTPTPFRRGTAMVTVWLHDNGGTANGGQDTSPAQIFTLTVGLATDADGDGLPDDWEFWNGLSVHEPSYNPATVDSDGDGFSDQQELMAGTSPVSSADALRAGVADQTNGEVAISFPTVPGKVYRVERNANFPEPSSWVQVGSDVTGTGAAVEIIDAAASALPKGVYRVVVP